MREGRGTEQSPYGQYIGHWKNDLKSGRGQEKAAIGTCFDGTWDKGRKSGRGTRKMVFGAIEEQVGSHCFEMLVAQVGIILRMLGTLGGNCLLQSLKKKMQQCKCIGLNCHHSWKFLIFYFCVWAVSSVAVSLFLFFVGMEEWTAAEQSVKNDCRGTSLCP